MLSHKQQGHGVFLLSLSLCEGYELMAINLFKSSQEKEEDGGFHIGNICEKH